VSKQIFSKILVPIDGSEESIRAAHTAIEVAKRFNSYVTLIHVVNIDQYLQALGLYRVTYPDSIKKRVEEAKHGAGAWFTEIQKDAELEKVKVMAEIIDTPLSIVGAIVSYAEREKTDLIVIGTRGRSGFKKLLLGSVASGVVTYAHCPVMVAK
jgi:nucleotide-binding universal stress UspA family protein